MRVIRDLYKVQGVRFGGKLCSALAVSGSAGARVGPKDLPDRRPK